MNELRSGVAATAWSWVDRPPLTGEARPREAVLTAAALIAVHPAKPFG